MQHLARLRRAHYSQLRSPRQGASTEAPALSVLEGAEVEYQAVPNDSPCLGRTLAELAFRNSTGAMVLGVLRRERTLYNVSPNFQLEQGDTLILLGSDEEIQRARQLLHGHPL